MKRLLGVLLLSAFGVVGCKAKCAHASVDKAITRLDKASVEALSQLETGGGAQMCDAVMGGSGISERPALVFSGSMASAWKTVEDTLEKTGWERVKQGDPPKSDATFFLVDYKRKGRAKPYDGPTLSLELHWNGGCKFGDVCVNGRVVGNVD